MLIAVCSVWAMTATVVFLGAFWTRGSGRRVIVEFGRLSLWLSMIVSAGSLFYAVGEETWRSFFIALADNANVVRLAFAFGVWVVGLTAFLYFIIWFKRRLG